MSKLLQGSVEAVKGSTQGVCLCLTALMAPVAVLKRFTSWAESTDRPLLMEDETKLTPSPLEFGSISESGLKNIHIFDFTVFYREV